MIVKSELKYIGLAFVLAFLWMGFLIPNIDRLGIGSDPLLRFLIFNVGIFLLLQVVLKAVVLDSRIRWSEILGLVMVANGTDLLSPPFVYNTLGQPNISMLLAEGSSDYVAGLLWSPLVSGFGLYLAVYVITPVLLFLGAGFLLKNFVRNL